MKRWVIILLLVTICSYSFGYIIIYEQAILLARLKSQWSLRSNSETKVITKIEISHKAINPPYVIENNELIYYGKIYDILWSEESQNGTKFYCVYDDSENQLRSILKDIYSNNPSTDNKILNLKFILSKLNLQYTFPQLEPLLKQLVLLSVLFPLKSSLIFTFLFGDPPPPKA